MSLEPEQVSAILRDPDSPCYPTRIAVFCDRCGTEHAADYLVHEADDQPTRLGYARKHLRSQGWRCDETGDFCPSCKPQGDSSG
jgi:hypothetical protein